MTQSATWIDFELRTLDFNHPYPRERQFSDETIKHFGLGFCNRGMLKGRIAIPLHDFDGRLVGYAGRKTKSNHINEKCPKYLLPGDRERNGKLLQFRKSHLLYNAHRVTAPVDNLFVVQGFSATWWLWQNEYRNVVAVMGSECSTQQGALIAELVKPEGVVWLMPDGNPAGKHCAHSLFDNVAQRRFVRWTRLDEQKQPTDYQGDQLTTLFV